MNSAKTDNNDENWGSLKIIKLLAKYVSLSERHSGNDMGEVVIIEKLMTNIFKNVANKTYWINQRLLDELDNKTPAH